MSATKNIYIIYASQDEDVLRHLLLHLQPLEKDFDLTIWSDDAIAPNQHWKPRDVTRIEHTGIFLLLLSNTFMYSEFIRQDEFKALIDRYKNGWATIIPVVVDNCPWDIEFTCDDYNYNFRELQVFPKNQKHIGAFNSSEDVFKEVTDYVRGLLTSSAKIDVLEKPHEKSQNNTRNTNKVAQIAIDFFEESEVKDKAKMEKKSKNDVEVEIREEENNRYGEDAEAKEVVKREKILRQKSEIRQRIEKEKELKGKAIKNNKIEEGAELEGVPKDEKWENEEVKSKKVENRRYEIAKNKIGSIPDKGSGEDLITQERVIRRNRLTRYNYQFKSAKVVEARSVVKEKGWGNEEASGQMAVRPKGGVRIQKSERDTELRKRLGEVISAQEIISRKKRLTGHNYQFKPPKLVEAKTVVREEIPENQEPKIQRPATVKKHVGIPKSESGFKLEKRLVEVVTTVKRTLKNGLAALYNYKFKWVIGGNRSATESKKKKSTNEIARIYSGFVVNLEKRLRDAVETLKRIFKNGWAVVHDYKFKWANEAHQGTTEAENKKSTNEISRLYSEFVIKIEKRLRDAVETLERTFKNAWAAVPDYKFKWVNDSHQGTTEAENKKSTNEIGSIYAGFVVKMEKRLRDAVENLERTFRNGWATVYNYTFKWPNDGQQGTTVELKKKNTNRKRRIYSGFLIASLLICGLLIFLFTGNSEKQSTTVPEVEPTEVTSDAQANIETNSENQSASSLELGVGDTYQGGIVFSRDASNETGKIAYSEDLGPMPWKDAIKVHEQLGEGWRLPTLDELETMYLTIGQGAANVGRFADELYWSATPFDKYQARLLRFKDGNTSYHYNNALENRKFLVRAIRDFDR